MTMKSVSEERTRSEARQRELEKAEEHTRTQRASLDAEKLRLQEEQRRLSELALQLKHRSAEVERMAAVSYSLCPQNVLTVSCRWLETSLLKMSVLTFNSAFKFFSEEVINLRCIKIFHMQGYWLCCGV